MSYWFYCSMKINDFFVYNKGECKEDIIRLSYGQHSSSYCYVFYYSTHVPTNAKSISTDREALIV